VDCLPKMSLSVYTFGAPRVGNHAFARDFNERVPQLWNVINDQAQPASHHQRPLQLAFRRLLCQAVVAFKCVQDTAAPRARVITNMIAVVQDTVPRSGKFLFMYKRPGQRVLINSDGDMLVRC
jgi:Lipase (class 3)